MQIYVFKCEVLRKALIVFRQQVPKSLVPKIPLCYADGINDMNGKFLCPLTGLNDFDILGATPIIREKINEHKRNVATVENQAHSAIEK